MHIPDMHVARTLELASRLHAQGRLGEAEQVYRRVLTADPGNPDALHLLGVLLHQTRRTAEGIDLIRRAIAITPRVAQYHQNLARIYREIDNPAALAECLQQIAALDRRAIARRLRLARVLQAELHRPAHAIPVFREILSIDSAHGEALAGLATALHQTGDLRGALDCYERALGLCPDDFELLSNFGIALSEDGQLDRAAPILGRAVAIQPGNAVLWYNLGIAHTARRSNREAILAFQKAIEIDPNYPQAYSNLGLVSYSSGQLEGVAEFFARFLKTHADCALAHNHLGLTRLWQGLQDEAINSIRHALAINDDSDQTWDYLLMTLLNSLDDPAKIFQEHRAWARRHEGRYPSSRHNNDRGADRRIRIGYVSPDFRDHSVPLFPRADPGPPRPPADGGILLRQSADWRRDQRAIAKARTSLARHLSQRR